MSRENIRTQMSVIRIQGSDLNYPLSAWLVFTRYWSVLSLLLRTLVGRLAQFV
jgi:hypothetical protein